MSNSPLVNYTKISPNRYSPRNHVIDTITIHCVVGQCSVETLGNIFAPTARQASSNYGIGPDGRIGMYVEEKDASWCSSSYSNDNRAVTIEVASDTTEPYAVTEKAYNALIELVADICKRNGIKKLLWKADKSLIGQVDKQNMTVHRWFSDQRSCPGTYLYSRHSDIANKVNAKLGAAATAQASDKTSSSKILYKVRKSANDSKSQLGAFVTLENAKALADKNSGYSVFDSSGKLIYSPASKSAETKEFKICVSVTGLRIRTGAGLNSQSTGYIKPGVYTIVDTKTADGYTWGKLKSGAGWIALEYTDKIQ